MGVHFLVLTGHYVLGAIDVFERYQLSAIPIRFTYCLDIPVTICTVQITRVQFYRYLSRVVEKVRLNGCTHCESEGMIEMTLSLLIVYGPWMLRLGAMAVNDCRVTYG